jgi:hypothetical protein
MKPCSLRKMTVKEHGESDERLHGKATEDGPSMPSLWSSIESREGSETSRTLFNLSKETRH